MYDNDEVIPGLAVRAKYAMACVMEPLNELEANFLSWESEVMAFILGAVLSTRESVPPMLADVPWLAEAFREGQVKKENEFGRVLNGRWAFLGEICGVCDKAEEPINPQHGVCRNCIDQYLSDLRDAVYEAANEGWND